MNDEQYTDIVKSMAANEQEHKSFRRRLDEHDEALRRQGDILLALQRQGDAIERLTDSMTRMEQTISGMSHRLETIEREPGDKWKKIAFEVLKYVVIAGIAAAVTKLFS